MTTEVLGNISTRKPGSAPPGVEVERCFEPQTLEELGQVLAEASRERWGLLIMGGGTRLGWANSAAPITKGLSMLGIRGVDIFEPTQSS